MIKKNLNNKKVIKALTIGLSLAMAGQPLTAMAAEENPTPDLDNNTMPTYKDVENYGWTRATTYVPKMIEFIQKIIDKIHIINPHFT